MATSAYHRWDADGRPWKVAAPVKAVGERLRAHGYTVYYLGDNRHLRSATPEDHSPFGLSGWPDRHPYPYVLAMDVMPPKPGQRSKLTGQPLPPLRRIAAQMRADKMADHPGMRWLKYINWEPEGDYTGPCWHDSWQPDYARRASTDRGHIHASGRTDTVTSTAADGYDPVARILEKDDDMALTDKFAAGPLKGKTLEQVLAELHSNAYLAAVRTDHLANKLGIGGRLDEIKTLVQAAIREAAEDPELPAVPPMDDEQVAALADRVAAAMPTPGDIAAAVNADAAARLAS